MHAQFSRCTAPPPHLVLLLSLRTCPSAEELSHASSGPFHAVPCFFGSYFSLLPARSSLRSSTTAAHSNLAQTYRLKSLPFWLALFSPRFGSQSDPANSQSTSFPSLKPKRAVTRQAVQGLYLFTFSSLSLSLLSPTLLFSSPISPSILQPSLPSSSSCLTSTTPT